MTNQITILGSGTSTGVPMLGCQCDVCTSKEIKNKRLRSSILIETKKGKKILVDTTPDLRTQLLRENILEIHAVIITHPHADHLNGLDDLRPLTFPPKAPIPIFATTEDCQEIFKKFSYAFENKKGDGTVPRLQLSPAKKASTNVEKTIIVDEEFYTFLLPHTQYFTMCFSHEKMAYVIDCKSIPDDIIDFLKSKKLDLLILDCVKRGDHPTHLTLEKAMAYATQIGAKHTALTHLSHHFDHNSLCEELSTQKISIAPCCDGQKFQYN